MPLKEWVSQVSLLMNEDLVVKISNGGEVSTMPYAHWLERVRSGWRWIIFHIHCFEEGCQIILEFWIIFYVCWLEKGIKHWKNAWRHYTLVWIKKKS